MTLETTASQTNHLYLEQNPSHEPQLRPGNRHRSDFQVVVKQIKTETRDRQYGTCPKDRHTTGKSIRRLDERLGNTNVQYQPDVPRWLFVGGLTNVRDCGGWMTSSGVRIKQGLLQGLRNGQAPCNHAARKNRNQDDLKLKTDLDIRRYGNPNRLCPPLENDGVGWINIPIAPYADIGQQGKLQYKSSLRFLYPGNLSSLLPLLGRSRQNRNRLPAPERNFRSQGPGPDSRLRTHFLRNLRSTKTKLQALRGTPRPPGPIRKQRRTTRNQGDQLPLGCRNIRRNHPKYQVHFPRMMKILLPTIALSCLPIHAATRQDQLDQLAQRGWKHVMEVFYSPKTKLIYTSLPSKVTKARHFDNGLLQWFEGLSYGRGMEDTPILGGGATCSLTNTTSPGRIAEGRSLQIFRGMELVNTYGVSIGDFARRRQASAP